MGFFEFLVKIDWISLILCMIALVIIIRFIKWIIKAILSPQTIKEEEFQKALQNYFTGNEEELFALLDRYHDKRNVKSADHD